MSVPRPLLTIASMHSLLNMLVAEPEAVYFKGPVDTETLGIPDYHYVAMKVDDLGTICAKLNTTAIYTNSIDKFVTDVRSVFVHVIVQR